MFHFCHLRSFSKLFWWENNLIRITVCPRSRTKPLKIRNKRKYFRIDIYICYFLDKNILFSSEFLSWFTMPKRRNYISNITDSNMHNERYSVAKPYSSTLENQKRITANKIKEKLKELDDYLKKHSLKLS